MAKKILKNRTQFTSTLKNELYNRIQRLSKDTSIPISRLMDQAVEGLLDRFTIDKRKEIDDNEKDIT